MSRPIAWFLSICGLVGVAAGIALDHPIGFGIGLTAVVFGVRRLFYAEV